MSGLTITSGQLLEARGGLIAIGEYSLPDVKGAYALTKIKRQANLALEDLEQTRVALNEQHAKQVDGKPQVDDKGQYVHADPAAFNAAWTTLLSEPVTLAGCRAVTLDELHGATAVVRDPLDPKKVDVIRGVSSDVLFALGPFLVEPPSPPDAAK